MPLAKKNINLHHALELSNQDVHSTFPGDFEYDPLQALDEPFFPVINQPIADTSVFSELLDYSFPEEVVGGVAQVGEVIYIGDGVCKVRGLPQARIDDIINIKTEKGVEKALILGVEDTHLESVVMGHYAHIKQGDQVVATNQKLKVPVGKDLLGRVVNPLGHEMDGKGPFVTEGHRDVEFPAPPVMSRKPIFEPLKTGVMVIDSTIPIGKGQRELIIGDRKTGKSRTAIDIISNQKYNDVICVYVGIGIQAAKAKQTHMMLEERGAMKYTTLVIATSDDPPSLQYISAYVGTAMAEHFMYQKKNVLIVYDDLSKQAKAYRQVSLLLKRSPGRDAYPGDIFFLHSRLLERASKLGERLGEGSITALPIAETQSGDVSDYIITNLMSITDGHIYLDANMMHEGILPAVNSGTSVSRIGSKVQTSILKKVSERAARALARYAEVKSFETINTEVADDTLRDIRRGKRVKEIFAQDSEIAFSYDEIIVFLYLATSGKLDSIELIEFTEMKRGLLTYYRSHVDEAFKQKCDKEKEIEAVAKEIEAVFDQYMVEKNKADQEKMKANNQAEMALAQQLLQQAGISTPPPAAPASTS